MNTTPVAILSDFQDPHLGVVGHELLDAASDQTRTTGDHHHLLGRGIASSSLRHVIVLRGGGICAGGHLEFELSLFHVPHKHERK